MPSTATSTKSGQGHAGRVRQLPGRSFQKPSATHGKITDINVKECQATVNIGKEDGITKGAIFEICESVRKVGGIIHLEPICEAIVSDVEAHVAVLDIGEYKQKDYFHKDLVFRPNRDKAALVQKGYVIREKK